MSGRLGIDWDKHILYILDIYIGTEGRWTTRAYTWEEIKYGSPCFCWALVV
jgi:hypothetical protein